MATRLVPVFLVLASCSDYELEKDVDVAGELDTAEAGAGEEAAGVGGESSAAGSPASPDPDAGDADGTNTVLSGGSSGSSGGATEEVPSGGGHDSDACCLILLDEDALDNGTSTVEAAAQGFGIEPDVLVNDDRPTEGSNPYLVWNTDYAGSETILPGGQIGDEGWFLLPDDVPFDIEAFIAGNVPQSELDKIPDVLPLHDAELEALVGKTCTAVVYDSDISMNYDPDLGNLQGARYGLFSFTVLDVHAPGGLPESGSSDSLVDVSLIVEGPDIECGDVELAGSDSAEPGGPEALDEGQVETAGCSTAGAVVPWAAWVGILVGLRRRGTLRGYDRVS